MTKNYKYELQQNTYDCGIACLQTIFLNHHKVLKRSNLSYLVNKKTQGISMYDLIKVSEEQGLHAIGVKGNINDLKENNFPLIAHIIKNKYYFHYIVILEKLNKNLLIMDPDEGIKKISIKDFESESTNMYIIFENKKFIKEKDNRFQNLMFKLVKQNKKPIQKSLILSVLYSILTLMFNYYLVIMLSINNKTITTNFIIAFIFINIVLLKTFINYLKNKVLIKIETNIDKKLIPDIISHIIHLPYNYFIEQSTGEVATIINDIENLKDLVTKIFISIILDTLFIIIILIYMSFINIIYPIIIILLGVLLLFITKKYQNTFNNNYQKLKQAKIEYSSYIYNILTSFNTIKNLNIENQITLKIKDKSNDMVEHEQKYNKKYYKYQLVEATITDIFYIFLILFCVIYYLKIDKNATNIILLSNMFFLTISFINNVTESITIKNIYKVSINRILDILDLKKEIFNKSKFSTIKTITFNQVNYINNKNHILKDINLSINNKDKVFIKGESGVGKSTLIRLLLRQQELTSGKILIDDISIKDLDLSFIRNKITYVSQNESIFPTSIIENMKIIDNDEEKIKKACKTVLIPEIFENNPNYLSYIIEEDGNNLSGGQRKKIILARALLKATDILILDECFNEISTKEEEKILKNIFNNYKNLTIVLISHRNSNMNLFNKIFEIKKEELNEKIN